MNNLSKTEIGLGLAVILMALFLKLEYNKNVKLRSQQSLSNAVLQSAKKDDKITEIRSKVDELRNRKIVPTSKGAADFWNGLYKK